MRTSVINRFAKLAPLSVATLLLTSGITLITADTAWACGGPVPAQPVYDGPRTTVEPVQGFIPELPRTITVGGPKVEVGIELFNGTGSTVQRVAPGFGLQSSRKEGDAGLLGARDVSVEVMVGGAWKTLPVRNECGALYTDTSALKGPLDDGHAKRFMFRVGVRSGAPATADTLTLFSTDQPADLKILRPAAAPKPTPSAAKATVPAVTPAEAPKTTPGASATATPAAGPAAELASTGPKTPTAALVGSAAALLAVGTAALLFARRRTAR